MGRRLKLRRPFLERLVAPLQWGLVAAGADIAFALVWNLLPVTVDSAPAPATYSITLPPGLMLNSDPGHAPPLAISPDGRTVAFTALDLDNEQNLYIRGPDAKVEKLPGTKNAEAPFEISNEFL